MTAEADQAERPSRIVRTASGQPSMLPREVVMAIPWAQLVKTVLKAVAPVVIEVVIDRATKPGPKRPARPRPR